MVVYDYSNYFADEVISIELLEGETVSLIVLTENFAEGDVAIAVAKAVPGAAPESVEGEYRYVDPDSWTHRWQLVFDANGTGTLKEQNFADLEWSDVVSSTFTYTYADGVVTIDFEDGAQAADGSYTVSADAIAAVVLNGSPVDFAFFE